jgi:hypothetical protein
MAFDLICISVLATLNILQAIYIVRLIDRLMSRNYYDYTVTRKYKSESGRVEAPKDTTEDDYEDMGILESLR